MIFCAYSATIYAHEKKSPYQNFNVDVKKARIKSLSKEQKYITQKGGTEEAGSGKYYNFFKPGIYVDVVSGEPLFSSSAKYQADSGWPAFTKPINKQAIKIIKTKTWYGTLRHKVSSSIAISHLGDVFLDRYIKNPSDAGKVLPNNSKTALPRYCIDSGALKFISLADMKKEGYGKYIKYVVSTKSKKVENDYKKAIFAGGCFWCLESDFDYFEKHNKLSHGGIIKVISGYAGGHIPNPTYELVSSGTTDYKESIEVIYNPRKISYKSLVEYFYRRINPIDNGGQFCDRGPQYSSAIYYTTIEQKTIAEAVTAKLKKSFIEIKPKTIYTQLLSNTKFYPAENYHQDYHDKNPKRYCYYRTSCGRDKTISKVWQSVKWPYSKIVPFDVPSSIVACAVR